MMTYNESKQFLKDKGLKGEKAYNEYWNANKIKCQEIGLPRHPHLYYANTKEAEDAFNALFDKWRK